MPNLNPTLYELNEFEQELFELLSFEDESGVGLPPEQQDEIIDSYLEAGHALGEKADRYLDLADSLKAKGEFQKAKGNKLIAASRVNTSTAERLEQRLMRVAASRPDKTIDTPLHVIKVVNNGGKLSVVVPPQWEKEPASAPEQFHRRKIELDKDAVRKQLEEDGEIKDSEGNKIAYFAERGTRLSIK